MPKSAKRNTVYGAYVRHTVEQLIGAGQMQMTVQDIAKAGSLKVTGNLRRQVHKLVADGLLCYASPSERAKNQSQLYWVPPF